MKEQIKNYIEILKTNPAIPDFLIIGAQKAGTTSLDSYLKANTDVKGTKEKELHFFDKAQNYQKGIKSYLQNFRRDRNNPQQLLFESTPNYLFNTWAPEELKNINPNLKFIILLRDPIDRAFSAWNMFRSNFEKMRADGVEIPGYYKIYVNEADEFSTFKEVTERELLLIEKGIENAAFDETYTMLRKGLYAEQILHWYKFFPKENFLISEMSELTKNPLNYLNTVSKFLNISSFDDKELDFRARNEREYSSKIPSETQEKLVEFYKEPNQQLYDLVGVNYNWK